MKTPLHSEALTLEVYEELILTVGTCHASTTELSRDPGKAQQSETYFAFFLCRSYSILDKELFCLLRSIAIMKELTVFATKSQIKTIKQVGRASIIS